MEENQKKEEQKRIARECLRNFGLMDQVQEQFMTEDKLYYSERQNQIFDGILYWLSNKPEWLEKVRELEQEYGVLVTTPTFTTRHTEPFWTACVCRVIRMHLRIPWKTARTALHLFTQSI